MGEPEGRGKRGGFPSPLHASPSFPRTPLPHVGACVQTGDAHVAQATAMASLGDYDFVRQNLNFTRDNCNGIEASRVGR